MRRTACQLISMKGITSLVLSLLHTYTVRLSACLVLHLRPCLGGVRQAKANQCRIRKITSSRNGKLWFGDERAPWGSGDLQDRDTLRTACYLGSKSQSSGGFTRGVVLEIWLVLYPGSVDCKDLCKAASSGGVCLDIGKK